MNQLGITVVEKIFVNNPIGMDMLLGLHIMRTGEVRYDDGHSISNQSKPEGGGPGL